MSLTIEPSQTEQSWPDTDLAAVFPINFPFDEVGEIFVFVNGSAVAAAISPGTLRGGLYTGGAFTLPGRGGRGAVLVRRITTERQRTTLGNGQGLNAAALSRELSRLWMRQQETSGDGRRALRVPIGEEGGELPDRGERAGNLLGFGPEGGLLAVSIPSVSDGPIRLPGAVQTLSNGSFAMLHGLDVRAFGAKPDGVSDCTTAFQLAATAARATGVHEVLVPPGKWRIHGGGVDIRGIRLRGTGPLPQAPTFDRGALVLLTGTGESPFLYGCGTVVEGLAFHWPNQIDSATAPIPYPVLFRSVGGTKYCVFRDLLMLNCWRGWTIGANDVQGGGMEVERVRGFFIDRIATVLSASETTRFTDCHFSYGWAIGNGPIEGLIRYSLNNNLGIVADTGNAQYTRCDGLLITGCWFWSLRSCLSVVSGILDVSRFGACSVDGSVAALFVAPAAQVFNLLCHGIQICAAHPYIPTVHAPCFDIQSNTGTIGSVTIVGCHYQSGLGEFARVLGTGVRDLVVTGNRIFAWMSPSDGFSGEAAAIYLESNGVCATITGNQFRGDYPQSVGVHVQGAGVATITGNTFISGVRAVNIASVNGRALVDGNLAVNMTGAKDVLVAAAMASRVTLGSNSLEHA